MALTITSVGYPGELADQDFARIVDNGFGRVLGPADLDVIAGAPGARRITVKAGSYDGQGIRDTIGADYTDLVGASVGAGSRWDCVVLHRHWEDGADETDVRLIQGTADIAYPVSLETDVLDVGADYDVPLKLVRFQAGSSEPMEFIDCRPFGGGNRLYLTDARAPLPPWAQLGQQVDRAGEVWVRRLVGGFATWQLASPVRAAPIRWFWGGVPYGWVVPDGGATQATGAQRIVPVLAGRRYHFESVFTLVDNGSGTIARAFLTINGGLFVDVEVGNDNPARVAFPVHLSFDYVAVADGTVTVGTAFAGNVANSWQVYQNFASPYSTWRDDGPL